MRPSASNPGQRRHAAAVFFALAFALSWAFWVPAALASRGLIAFPLPAMLARLLGVFGPSLAALILTALWEGRSGVRALP